MRGRDEWANDQHHFSSQTFKAAVCDICTSLIRGGFKRILLPNGHNPNLMILQAAVSDLINELEDKEISLAAATYFTLAKEECDKVGDNFRDGTHANEMETSLMLGLYPDLVKMDRVREQVEEYVPRRVISFHNGAMILNKWPVNSVYSGV